MPTVTEIDELIHKCTWIWTTQGEHNGYKIMGPNGNSIFIPAAGSDGPTNNGKGRHFAFWSATPYDEPYAYAVWFSSGIASIEIVLKSARGYYSRDRGFSVRPVAPGKESSFYPETQISSPSGTIKGHGFVDLGLSVKWATCNIGALSPTDYGDYFTWGETKTKTAYTKENTSTSGKEMESFAGNSSYDAASANWGSSWRMPEKSEIEELVNKCKFTWTIQGIHFGYVVTGPNGNSIFLPAAGMCIQTSSPGRDGRECQYMSATPVIGFKDEFAYALNFKGDEFRMGWTGRWEGNPIRPVSQDNPDAVPVFSQKPEIAKAKSLYKSAMGLFNARKYTEAFRLGSQALKIQEKTLGKDTPQYTASLILLANCSYKIDNYEEAVRLVTEALEIQEKTLGKDNRQYTAALIILANSYYSLARYNASQSGNLTEAIRLCTESLQIREKVLGKNNPEYINTLEYLAHYYSIQENYPELLRCYTELADLQKKVYGKKSDEYIETLNNIAFYSGYLGNDAEAISIKTDIVDNQERMFGKESSEYITALKELAKTYEDAENYTEAVRIGEDALKLQGKVYGNDNSEYADILCDLAEYYNCIENFGEAVRLETQALEIRKNLPKNIEYYGWPTYCKSLNDLAYYHSRIGNYDEADRLETEALEFIEKTMGKDNTEYSTVLRKLVNYKISLGNYSEAIRLATEVVEIDEKIWGDDKSAYANSLRGLATCYENLCDYHEAIRLYTQALDIIEENSGKESTDYAYTLTCLALPNSSLGNYTKALLLETEALAIYEKTVGKNHRDYAYTLSKIIYYNTKLGNEPEVIRLTKELIEIIKSNIDKNDITNADILNELATKYLRIGNYAEAIRLGNEALEIIENANGKENKDYTYSLSELASYYGEMNNFTEAVRIETEALEIIGKVSGKDSRIYAESLRSLGNYNCDLGNYAEAIRIHTLALKIYEKICGKESCEYGVSLMNLGIDYYNSGNMFEAIRLTTEYLDLRDETNNFHLHPDYASYAHYLKLLALFYHASGNYSEAIRIVTRALELREKVMGEDHPDNVEFLKDIVNYNCLDGQYAKATDYIVKATKITDKIVRTTFSDLTANERALFWDKYSDWFEENLPKYTYYIQNDSLTATAYDGTLLSKGLLLNSELEMSKLLLESGDTAVVAKYEELKNNRALLNKMIENRYADLQAISDTVLRAQRKVELEARIDSLEKRLQMRERELMQESKVYGDYTKNLSIGWREVQDRLGEKDVAVEFLNFGARNDSVMYVALTLIKEDEVPHLIPLFEAKELAEVEKEYYYNTQAISKLVWQPLAETLKGKENIYFAPAGELHNIAVESVPSFEGEWLMSDRWNLYRLSSTRELALIKDENELKDACLYGDLRYDMNVDAIVANGQKYTSGKRSVDWEVANIADSLKFRQGAESLGSLPGTKKEVESIDRSLKSQNIRSLLLTDTLGTEASFKALSGQRTNVLHLATHGFYWPESEAKRMDIRSMAMMNEDDRPKYVEDKALTRSGLFLAGAENALRDELPDGVDDGILTAKEISTLDLRGLDLVVLSACETGLGEITGDGVFGLQRGFKKAGANTLMMSLWKVDDNATQILMSQFYQNLAEGESKYEAFHKAQEYLRSTENGKYSDPRYWAAFILLDGIN